MATEAVFPITLESNAKEVSKEAADAMEKLRASIEGSTNKIRALEQSQRLLKGSTQEVIKAKTDLKAKIVAEQAEVTKASLALNKMGKSYGELAQQAKKATAAETDAVKAESNHTKEGNRLVAALKGLDIVGRRTFRQMNELKEATGGMSGATGIALVGILAMTVAIVELVKRVGEAAIEIGKFIIESANMQRNMLLTQEGLLGSAKSASNFADQIDDIAKRVPLAKDEISKLGDELAAGGLQGDKLVDAMNAVAQTASAKGAAAGDKLKEKLIASMGAGAKQARQAAEKQFGQLNSKKLLDLNVQGQRFKETMEGMTRDINLEPLLNGLQEILSIFDQSTVSGQAIHDLITMIGDGLSTAVGDSAPTVKTFLKQLLIYGLEGAIVFFQLKNRIRDAFGPETAGGISALDAALGIIKVSIGALVIALVGLYGAWRAITALLSGGWIDVGKSIISGLVSGITGGASELANAVTGLAGKVKDSFKNALGIHSPSTVFAEYGENVSAGVAQGVDKGAPAAQSAVTSMVGPPSGGAAGGGGRPEVHVHIEVGGGGGGDVAKQLTQPSVLAALTKAVEDALSGNGLVPGAA